MNKRSAQTHFLLILSTLLLATGCNRVSKTKENLSLWYASPAKEWTEALSGWG